ncbi:MAG: hypothetical protein P8X48_07235 [Acidiferrobacteraceae bacterium]|jgi:DNA-directed RNA polymerase subunit RPC12/RpoP
MSDAKERAKAIAAEIKAAMKEARAAEKRAAALGKELTQVLAEIREADAPRKIVEYPPGRYECLSCGQITLLTSPVAELSECDNCGQQKFSGPEPKVTIVKPPPPKRYPAGMYRCQACGAQTALINDTDTMPECDFCGEAKLERIGGGS